MRPGQLHSSGCKKDGLQLRISTCRWAKSPRRLHGGESLLRVHFGFLNIEPELGPDHPNVKEVAQCSAVLAVCVCDIGILTSGSLQGTAVGQPQAVSFPVWQHSDLRLEVQSSL